MALTLKTVLIRSRLVDQLNFFSHRGSFLTLGYCCVCHCHDKPFKTFAQTSVLLLINSGLITSMSNTILLCLLRFWALWSCASLNNSGFPSFQGFVTLFTVNEQFGKPSGTTSGRWTRMMALVSPLCTLMKLSGSRTEMEKETIPGIFFMTCQVDLKDL